MDNGVYSPLEYLQPIKVSQDPFYDGYAEEKGIIVFPPSFKEERIESVKFICLAKTLNGSTSNPTFTVQIRSLDGPLKRVLSSGFEILSSPTKQWVEIPLIDSPSNRTLASDELLLVIYDSQWCDTNKITGFSMNHIMWNVTLK